VRKANKRGKIRDHGYRDLGYSGFVNDVSRKKGWMPQPRETWFSFPGKRRPSRMTKKKICICWKQRLYKISKEINNNLV
jgi:hypothetical protein